MLGAAGLVIVAPKVESPRLAVSERVGVIQRRSNYRSRAPCSRQLANPAHQHEDSRRVVFVVRLDGGIGSEGVTIDQTLDATTALLREGDQVSVKLVDNVHIESTVAPVFAWGNANDAVETPRKPRRVLRTGEFPCSKGVPSVASLFLADAPSAGLVVRVRRHNRCIEAPSGIFYRCSCQGAGNSSLATSRT